MRLAVLNNIEDVVREGLCCGCGACAHVQRADFVMQDVAQHGRRPARRGEPRGDNDAEAMKVCPGLHVRGDAYHETDGARTSEWGRVLEVWEGYAADKEIRFRASSGGVMTALALHCLESGMHGVLHVRARRDAAYLNETVLSRSREELLMGAGSRYSPASPCERLDLIEKAPGQCVFIGKPCDVAAVQMIRRQRRELDARIGLTMAMFCGGTPSTQGTLEMLRVMGIADPADAADVRYRGDGWPGEARARTVRGEQRSLSYVRAWGEILTKHKQWRCKLCADHGGALADLAIGDAWHRDVKAKQPGVSLVVVRTERGQAVLREAMEAGAVALEPSGVDAIRAAQPGLMKASGHAWGRALALRALGRAAPRFDGVSGRSAWWRRLSAREKAQSLLGTVRRVLQGRVGEDVCAIHDGAGRAGERNDRAACDCVPAAATRRAA